MTAARNDAGARAYIDEHFGVLSYFVNDPEIGPMLMQAGYEQWDQTRLQTALMSTNWWRQHSDAEREYITLEQTDPAKLGRIVGERAASIANMAFSLGIAGVDVQGITQQAVRFGWSDEQVQDMLASRIDMSSAHRPGAVSTWYNQTKEIGRSYFVDVDDTTALSYAQKIASGELKAEDVQGYYRDQAKQRYGYLAGAIDSGINLREYFAPHQQALARTLEIAPESIDFMDDKWSAVTRTTDPTTGEERSMTLSEVAKFARSQESWQLTDNARSASAGVISALGDMFGKM